MMMERILLGVLCLSGWDIFSSCLLHQYHYVADPMNWTEAQTYCRKTYTDLATIENTEEVNQLINVSSSGLSSDVWIGLYTKINWRWSDSYTGTGFRGWGGGYPILHYAYNYFCVSTYWYYLYYLDYWMNYDCTAAIPFICNNGTQLQPEFVYVNEPMNWSSAQRYCRENFIDLATVRNDTENQQIQSLMQNRYYFAWFGLFREPDIYWSDGSGSSFTYWYTGATSVGLKSVACGVAALQSSGRWWFFPCETRLPFVCYSVPGNSTGSSIHSVYTPVKRHAVKLRIKLEDSSVDLNDPAVKADMLKKLQDRLKEKGVSGVTLKWREQPDGKVFHKENKTEL